MKFLRFLVFLIFLAPISGFCAADYIPEYLTDLAGDVLISNPQNNQVLTYDSGKWKNKAAGEASMVYPGAGVAVSTGTGWDTSIAANTIIYTSAIGSTVQAYDADLTTYAGITPSANAQTLLGETFAQMLSSIGAEGADANIIKSGEIDTSAELLAILGDETGSASGTPLLVFNQSPVLVTPKIDHIGENTGSHGVVFDNPITTTSNIKGTPKHLRFTIIDPKTAYGKDHEICIWKATDAAITVTNLEVTCNADPTTEPTGDLKYADTFVGLANATVINAFDTANGVLSDSSMTSGAVASGKAIYISFDAEPDAALTQISFDVTYDYD